MPAPNNPNTGPANRARRQVGHRKAVARLRLDGFLIISPDHAAAAAAALEQAGIPTILDPEEI